jgi:hypothetical protein
MVKIDRPGAKKLGLELVQRLGEELVHGLKGVDGGTTKAAGCFAEMGAAGRHGRPDGEAKAGCQADDPSPLTQTFGHEVIGLTGGEGSQTGGHADQPHPRWQRTVQSRS